MAKKKLNPLEDPPSAEVETLSAEEEEISDDSASDEEDYLFSPVPSKKPKTSAKVASGSKNPTAAAAVTVASPSKRGSKRPREEISVHAKRSKKEEDTKKPPLFQRLWSEEDEISLLQGMIDFNSETGKSPYEDMDGFYDFIKKSISFEPTKNKTAEKIRSLKKKYNKKVQKGGVESSMPKAHDVECFKLSECIWGSDGMALKSNVKKSVKPQEKEVESDGSLKKKLEANGDDGEKEEEGREVLDDGEKVQVDEQVLVNGDSKSPPGVVMTASDWFEDSFLVGSIASLGVGEGFVRQKWSTVAVETKKKMEEKWKLLQAKEMELVLEKTDFMREVGSVIAEAS